MADYRLPMDADGVKYHGTIDQNEENPGQFMYGLDENGNKRIIRTDEQGNVLTKVTGSKVGLVDSKSSIEITIGSSVYVFGSRRNHDGWYSQYIILLSSNVDGEFRVEIDERPPQIGSNPTIFRVYDEKIGRLGYTGFLDVVSSAVRVRVYNESKGDRNVDIWMYGRV